MKREPIQTREPSLPREPIASREPKAVRAWSETGDDEPREAPEGPRRPAVFYAAPGYCEFCDRRRAAAARSMRQVRERGKGE